MACPPPKRDVVPRLNTRSLSSLRSGGPLDSHALPIEREERRERREQNETVNALQTLQETTQETTRTQVTTTRECGDTGLGHTSALL